MRWFGSLFGSDGGRYLAHAKGIIAAVRRHGETVAGLSDDALRAKTEEFRAAVAGGAAVAAVLPEAFAVVCEAAKRTTGMAPYDVQIAGALALHEGSVAEMRTGEGKTLVAVLSAYLNALSGKPVHVVTVNDYLARRDAVWMGQIYAALGMAVGVVNGQDGSYRYDPGHREKDAERDEKGSYKIVYDFLREVSRKEVYACDIVYGTNNEIVFDYLRDNIEYRAEHIRQRGFFYAIVDEVDSILIDEARSPLIISAPANIPASQYAGFARFAETLAEGEDYTIDEKQRAVSLSSSGIEKFEEAMQVKNVFVEGGQRSVHYLQNALKAKSLYKKDKQYVVRDGTIVIVDEFTGRLQPGRRWSEGLHQAIEAKEGVAVQQESRTYASITFQNYFRMYEKLAGMTGTAKSSEEEFYKVYRMPVVSIPTNRGVQRVDNGDVIYQTQNAKMRAIVERIGELHAKGQPVLVGTASIDHNERLSKRLKKAKVPHEVLNAKNHEREGEIIAQAGRKGAVTIATNLAGRGVDIKLGGVGDVAGGAESGGGREDGSDSSDSDNAESALAEEVKALGGLFVLGTERHESRRIDNQLRGRCGRQGDPGETQFYLSLEDDLTRVFGSDQVRAIAQKLGLPEDQAVRNRIISKSIESAQKRIEGHHFDTRRFSFEYDTVLNKQRSEVYTKRNAVLFAKDPSVFKEYVGSDGVEALKDDSTDTTTSEETNTATGQYRSNRAPILPLKPCAPPFSAPLT